MADVTDINTNDIETEHIIKYDGIYSKLVDKFYFKCEKDNSAIMWGIRLKKYTKPDKTVRFYYTLKEPYYIDENVYEFIDNLLYDFLNDEDSRFYFSISLTEVRACEREYKIKKLKNKLKKPFYKRILGIK